MMKRIVQFAVVGLLIVGSRYMVLAQEKADPAAQKVLRDVRAYYEKPDPVRLDLQLTLMPAEQEQEVRKGHLVSHGDKFSLDLGPQAWYCDGKTVWIHLKDQKEVQIHNARDASGQSPFLTPRDLLKRYDNGDYLYAMTGTGTENKRAVRYIEFKPRDRYDDLTKLRLCIDARTPEIVRFEAFSRDGSRYALDVLKTTRPVSVTAQQFVFRPADHHGVTVEDLRLD